MNNVVAGADQLVPIKGSERIQALDVIRGFALIGISLQIVFCRWWLARFYYGPMEWLWRAITYWQLPVMRRPAPDMMLATA